MNRTSRWVATLAIVGAVGITLAACASSPGSADTTNGAVPKLTVGTAAALPVFADIYVAEAQGYFKDAGVDVDIQTGVGANGLNEVVSGQLDLLMFGTGQALLPAARGIDTKVIYNQIGAGEGAAVAVAADSPYKTLADLTGKRVAVLAVGGNSYGWGQYYSKYATDHGGQPWDIIQASSVSDQVDGVLSGHFDALVSTAALLTSQVAAGQVRLLVDPTTADGKQYIGDQYAETSTFGVAKNLESKKDAVTRFVAAMQAADTWMHSAPPADIAAALKTTPAFDGQSIDAITAGVTYDKPFFAPALGEVTEPLWNATLKQLTYWGLPDVVLTDPTYSYGQRVDMSYLDAAKAITIDTGSK